MGFINSVSEQFKQSIKPKLDWKGSASAITNSLRKKNPVSVIAYDVEDQEFMLRYRNLRLTACSTLIFMSIAIITIPMAGNFQSFFMSLTASMLFFLFYFRYAFILWISRAGWSKAIDMEKPVELRVGDFSKAIINDAADFLPLKLPAKGVSK
jgi:hypothetical protein